MPSYTEPTDGKASLMMWDACLSGSGPYVHCSCGIDHYDKNATTEDIENNTVETYDYSELDGQTFVYECTGCNERLAKYERFVWANRDNIRRYLSTRINQEKAWADHEVALNKLAGI